MSSPEEWTLVPGKDGWWIVDLAYEEDIGFAAADYTDAKRILDKMVADEMSAQAEEAYERHCERLMGGDIPSLQEQQIAARKLK